MRAASIAAAFGIPAAPAVPDNTQEWNRGWARSIPTCKFFDPQPDSRFFFDATTLPADCDTHVSLAVELKTAKRFRKLDGLKNSGAGNQSIDCNSFPGLNRTARPGGIEPTNCVTCSLPI